MKSILLKWLNQSCWNGILTYLQNPCRADRCNSWSRWRCSSSLPSRPRIHCPDIRKNPLRNKFTTFWIKKIIWRNFVINQKFALQLYHFYITINPFGTQSDFSTLTSITIRNSVPNELRRGAFKCRVILYIRYILPVCRCSFRRFGWSGRCQAPRKHFDPTVYWRYRRLPREGRGRWAKRLPGGRRNV